MTPRRLRRVRLRSCRRAVASVQSPPHRPVGGTQPPASSALKMQTVRSTVVSGWRMLFASATVLAGVLLSACGSSAQAQVAPVIPTGWATSADPSMISISLSDGGFQASNVSLLLAQQVMFMVFDAGSHPHGLGASLPMAAALVVDPATNAQPHSIAKMDLTVQPGEELDVTFTPTVAGTYALNVDGRLAAHLVVLAAANDPAS